MSPNRRLPNACNPAPGNPCYAYQSFEAPNRRSWLDRMSTTPETDFDLEKLFLPAWAQESPTVNRYAKHPGDDRPERRFDDRQGGRRPGPRRDGPRPAGGGGGPRPAGAGGGPGRGPQGGGPQNGGQ